MKLLHGASALWPLYVPFVQLVYNNKVQELTGSAPFSLMFGRRLNEMNDYSDDKPMPVDLGSVPLQVHRHIATIGVDPIDSDSVEMAVRFGAQRVCAIGQMQNPSVTWHHDGQPTLVTPSPLPVLTVVAGPLSYVVDRCSASSWMMVWWQTSNAAELRAMPSWRPFRSASPAGLRSALESD